VDLSQLRYFNAVARHGSFSAAAAALGVSQPGLTKAIRRLEGSLACKLFARLPRGVALTPEGEVLLRHASQLDIRLQDAREEIRGLGRGAVGELRIGAGPSWLGRALPRIVVEMTAQFPQLRFQVVAGLNARLMESLRIGELDLLVSALPDLIPSGLHAIPLTADTLSIVARDGHPLFRKRKPQPAQAVGYPWVLPGRDVLSRQRLDALFRVAGLEPPAPQIESDSIAFVAAVLRESDMLSFATSRIVRREMDGVTPIEIPGLSMTRAAGLLFRSSSGVTPATKALIEAAKRVGRELGSN
jgi:DNA-binding transcriptional LysR family regulator